ncbi:Cyclin pch1 [Pseudocercospora fuligena]|uniref:RNA polymerase II holoenzyme cyclin-like subunit n=1 Tax=Pseudocercospora fuligena TaxID=685502 RepID=A0A8H6RHQ8_9PEZI|nr:Cyclin pch1 [Pseudocercospora fuligena]
MPPPSNTNHLPSTHPATRQRPKSPNAVLQEAEAQWIFTDEELANTPSVQDGMSVDEERDKRVKGINFIVQVGIMLKLPQLTLSTASIFFQRFLMRGSLKRERNGIPKLHHFQAAATALFLATKVEESCRKMKELVLAFCRVAQKNPNLVVDEQSKDFWKWRDLILHNEDHMLETLCFDLTVESPHRQLFEMLKYYGVEHNKRLRNAAWGFVTDSNNTQLCLLVSSRVIAVTSLYAACKQCDMTLPDDSKGRPWWESQHVRTRDIRRAVEFILANYDPSTHKMNGIPASGASEGNDSIYAGLLTPAVDGGSDSWEKTRARENGSRPVSPYPASERRASNASSIGTKRGRAESQPNGDSTSGDKENKRPRLDARHTDNDDKAAKNSENGVVVPVPQAPAGGGEVEGLKEQEEALRVQNGNEQAALDVKAAAEQQASKSQPQQAQSDGEVSEEGELEE